MKNKSFLSKVAGLGIVLSLGLLSFNSDVNSYKAISSSKLFPALVSYHYDSVKVTSTYKFDHAAAAATEAYARVVYPVFQNNYLNNLIKTAVLSPVKVKYQFKNAFNTEHPALSNLDAINKEAADYRDLGNNFLRQFEAQAPQEDLKAYWYSDIEVKVLTAKQDYIALLCKKDYFTGGMHDLYDNTYLNYDVRAGRVFDLASQLRPGEINQLTTIAEGIFRKNESLAPAQDLEAYFFKDQKFSLPSNFTITGKGLIFFYDYYEIKPFAAGTTQLVIPFARLKGLILPNSILAGHLNGH
jgi:hypothetical protein